MAYATTTYRTYVTAANATKKTAERITTMDTALFTNALKTRKFLAAMNAADFHAKNQLNLQKIHFGKLTFNAKIT
ncbi:MAG: hypothetical protein V1911_00025 [Candidatus Micrarchaeota archaeon]